MSVTVALVQRPGRPSSISLFDLLVAICRSSATFSGILSFLVLSCEKVCH
jgi:hypothetical protein